MASQVLSGSGNVSYTNNTGQIVRFIINSVSCIGGSVGEISVSWGTSNNLVSITAKYVRMLGKNLAHSGSGRKISSTLSGLSPINYITTTNCDGMIIDPYTIQALPIRDGSIKPSNLEQNHSLPTEIYLNPLDIVSISGRSYVPPTSSSTVVDLPTTSTSPIGGYNIIIIPENG